MLVPSDMISTLGKPSPTKNRSILQLGKSDHFRSGQTAEVVHNFIARNVPGPHPPVHRPFNWVKLVTVTTGILGTISFVTVAWPYITPVIQNRNLWAAISLIAVLLFTSGHMFNHIRKVPYVSGDGKGNINYFAGGFQNQWGLETQIIAAVCTFYLFL